MLDLKPTVVLLDTPHDERVPEPRTRSMSPSPSCESDEGADIHTPDEALYGLDLLQKIITEAHLRGMSKLVVPIPMISGSEEPTSATEQMTDGAVEPFTAPLGSLASNRQLIRRCLDLGAVDIIISPLSSKCITTLEICAYRAHRDAAREQQALMEIRQGRKRSWVGVNEEKPFAYLREAMVSGLMKGICRLSSSNDDQINKAHIAVSSERQAAIAVAVGSWHFCAHSFTDDELLVAAMAMFKHALSMSELERWRIPAGKSGSLFSVSAQPCSHPCSPTTRPAHLFSRGLSRCLQQLCSVPQLPPRSGCLAGDLQLLSAHRFSSSLSSKCPSKLDPRKVPDGILGYTL